MKKKNLHQAHKILNHKKVINMDIVINNQYILMRRLVNSLKKALKN